MELIDTHCHIDIERHFPDVEEVLQRSLEAGVTHFVLTGVYCLGWDRLLRLAKEHPQLHAAPGLHPMYLDFHREGDIELLSRLVEQEQLVGIGEVGLDYHINKPDKEAQQLLFEAQLQLAQKQQLPMLLHVRKAHDQVLATLRRTKFSYGGIVHAFNGSFQQAEHYIQLGFMIGICGTITYDRAKKIRRVAAALPLESLVLETDSPDIPPQNHWGERNSPEYLPQIAAALAEIRQIELEIVATQTTRNARKILGI